MGVKDYSGIERPVCQACNKLYMHADEVVTLVVTLEKPIKALNGAAPPVIFVLEMTKAETDPDDMPQVDMALREYVRMDWLSKELQDKIRETLIKPYSEGCRDEQ